MESKKAYSVESSQQLLTARKEALQQIHRSSLRAHGKWRGMDVFTWCNVMPEQIAATVESFPFEVVWFADKSLIEDCASLNSPMWESIEKLAAIDWPEVVSHEWVLQHVPVIVGTQSIQEAMISLEALQKKGAVLLFTSNSVDWHNELRFFEEFIRNK